MAGHMLSLTEALEAGLSTDPFEFTDCTDRVPARDHQPDATARWYESRWFFVAHHHIVDAHGEPMEWLSIRRNDREPLSDFRDLQRIKNAICGPEREAVQLYPAESRLLDESNQTHLWVFPEGVVLPFGYSNRSVMTATELARYAEHQAEVIGKFGGAPAQRPFSAGVEKNSRTVEELLAEDKRTFTYHQPANPRSA